MLRRAKGFGDESVECYFAIKIRARLFGFRRAIWGFEAKLQIEIGDLLAPSS